MIVLGDGQIDFDELMTVLKACLENNNLKVTQQVNIHYCFTPKYAYSFFSLAQFYFIAFIALIVLLLLKSCSSPSAGFGIADPSDI